MANQIAVIRNSVSRLVLDASVKQVKLKEFNGSLAQQWTVETLGNGNAVLWNKASRVVLDQQNGSSNVITSAQNGLDSQSWIIHANDIWNVASNLVVDTKGGNLSAGTDLIVNHKSNGNSQLFELVIFN